MGVFDGIEKAGRGPRATRKQLDFISDLCEQIGDDSLLVDLGENPTVQDASELIDLLLIMREETRSDFDEDYGFFW